jgi:hypothetical protein
MTRVHIHAPSGYYVGQTRRYGHRRWKQQGEDAPNAKQAMRQALDAMTENDKRCRVLFCAEWYDPIVVMELSV